MRRIKTYDNNRGLSQAPIILLECFHAQFIRFQFDFEDAILLLQTFDAFLELLACYRAGGHHDGAPIDAARVGFAC